MVEEIAIDLSLERRYRRSKKECEYLVVARIGTLIECDHHESVGIEVWIGKPWRHESIEPIGGIGNRGIVTYMHKGINTEQVI